MSQSLKPSMVNAIIRKDWYFNKNNLFLFLGIGLISVFLMSFESRLFYVGMVILISIVILIGALLVMSTIVNERKNQTLTFLMSLPITYIDFTKAKLLINIAAYFVAWGILVASTMAVIFHSAHLPNGLMPYALIVLIELMLSFILILAVALVSESELWTIVVMSITNVAVSLFMFLIASIENINQYMNGPVAVWNKPVLMIIGIEVFLGVIIIAITLFIQSRKKDFI